MIQLIRGAGVSISDVVPFENERKWWRVLERLDAFNTHKSASTKARITRNSLKVRAMIVQHGIDVFPVAFPTYAKQPDQFKWVMFTAGREEVGCTIPLNDLARYSETSILRHGGGIYEIIGEK